jgi:MFS family permease
MYNNNISQVLNSNSKTTGIYSGIFFVALSTLMYEILLTRIFSVTMGYHFAFMAVSVALFGMTVGAVIVYLKPAVYTRENAKPLLVKNSVLFSLTIILSFLFHLFVPFLHGLSVMGLAIVVLTYVIISVPFVFSGICVSLILTKFPERVNKLYAADLLGAALGCILVVEAIDIGDGPTAVFYTSFFAALSSVFFLSGSEKRSRVKVIGYGSAILLFAAVHTVLVNNNNPLIRLYWIRGEWAEKPLYEKWNSFSRVSIDGDSTKYEIPFGWGLSDKYDRSRKIRQLMLNIDAHSTTVLSRFDGNKDSLEHLKYDISNVVHNIRKDADVLVIGSGGGRDVLTSIAFNQKSVVGIEINKDMIKALNGEFGGFTGHLDKYPNVKFVGDEARSYIQRHKDLYDIIQVSVIDNWSATSSGAFVLTENALYTLENWKLMIDRLKPDGILTVTRFYRSKPSEIYRLISISTSALLENGITNPRDHLVLLKMNQLEREKDRSGTGVIMLCKTPFNKTELNVIDSICNVLKFEKALTPNIVTDSAFAYIASTGEEQQNYVSEFTVDITPPTDDKPFFFHLLRFRDLPNKALWHNWDMEFNVKAIFILTTLTFTMIVLTLACVLIPLKLTSKKVNLKGSGLLFLFFAGIGFGFMLVEISQIQRLNIFLGHPTYSIAASLFTLLLSSGLGSYISSKYIKELNRKSIAWNFISLIAVLLLFGLLTPLIIKNFREAETYVRVIIACLILFPIGLVMGSAFPLGMKSAAKFNEAITPWLWGVNGVTSVFASVLSVVIAMTYGISASFWTGLGFYGVASVSLIIFCRNDRTNKTLQV